MKTGGVFVISTFATVLFVVAVSVGGSPWELFIVERGNSSLVVLGTMMNFIGFVVVGLSVAGMTVVFLVGHVIPRGAGAIGTSTVNLGVVLSRRLRATTSD